MLSHESLLTCQYRTLIVSLVWLALFIPVVQKTSPDITWELSTILVCVTTEASLVIVCGCFPALRLFARRALPKWFGPREAGCERFVPPPLQPELGVLETEGYNGCDESKTTSGSPSDGNHATKGFGDSDEMKFGCVSSLPTRLPSRKVGVCELGVLPDP